MTQADDLQRLVERIEGATAPDREIDYRLFEFVRTDAEHCSYIEGKPYPAYTSSVDDALRLVPRGWAFSLAEMMGLPLERRWRCHLRDHNEPYNPATCAWVDKDCPTAPLAICAASLRARINQEKSNG